MPNKKLAVKDAVKEAPKKSLPNRITGTYGTMYYVKDMAKATAFLSDALGLKPAVKESDWVEFRFPGGHALCLHKSGEESHAGGSLVLRVDNLNAMVKDLKEQLIPVTEPKEVHPGAFSAHFKDRDGNTVGLYEELKK